MRVTTATMITTTTAADNSFASRTYYKKDSVLCIPPAPSASADPAGPLAQTNRSLHSHVPPPVHLNTTISHHPQPQPELWFPWRLKTSNIPSIMPWL